MIKLVQSDDFNWSEIPSSLMKVASTGLDAGWAEKRAAVLTKEMSELRPEKGKTLAHVFAVGDTEKYSANRNGDGFRGEWNARNYDYFTKSAHLYMNHKNHDPKLAVGGVKLAAYNPEMGRIELVIALDNEKCAQAVNDLESGKAISVSMGCKVAHDVCSICGHQAPNPSHYCNHAKYAMGRILDDGRLVYVDNPDPHYFDISVVPRPADRNAYSFRKVASGGEALPSSVILAKQAGLWVPQHLLSATDSLAMQKRAVLRKLAEMEKEIEAKGVELDPELAKSFEGAGKLDASSAKKLQHAGLDGVLDRLAEAKVVLPLRDFLRLISQDSYQAAESLAPEVEGCLPGVFGRMLDEGDPTGACEDQHFDGCPMALPGGVGELLEPLIGAFSGGAKPLGRRITISVISAKPLPGLTKSAGVHHDAQAEGVARLYAAYKLAVLSHPQNRTDDLLTRMAVMQNYVRA